MKTSRKISIAVIAVLSLMGLAVTAGHHFETVLAKKYPAGDLVDLFVFESSEPQRTAFVLATNPQTEKDKFNFLSNGIYKFHIGESKDFDKGQLFSFVFDQDQVKFYWDNTPENGLSETGKLIAEGPINRILELDNGIKIWTGSTLDNFQGNAIGAEAMKKAVKEGKKIDLSIFDVGEEGNWFGNRNSSVIVLEVPNELLPKKIYYYASSAFEEAPDHWHQINHIGNVLFPHFYIDLNDTIRTKFGAQGAVVDPEVLADVKENLSNFLKSADIYKGDHQQYIEDLISRTYPDIVPYEVGTKAAYDMEKFNGRPLNQDAMDNVLGLVLGAGKPIDDKVYVKLDRYQPDFPYVKPIDDVYLNATEKVIKVNVQAAIGDDDSAAPTAKAAEKNSSIWMYLMGAVILLAIIVLARKKNS